MKKTLAGLVATVFCLVLGAGCAALLEKQPSPTSPLVTVLGAQTNVSVAQAWLQAASTVNSVANPTATQEPIAIVLTALTTLTGGLAGWYARHKTVEQTAANQLPAGEKKS